MDGIPRFVPSSGYADGFGRQWNRFRLTQLDSRSGLDISRKRLRRVLGEQQWAGLAGARVLEVGCGAGRFTEVLLGEGANVVSVDLSSAIDANGTTFPPSERHALAQASVLELPLPSESFDFVVALGMIQHTPSSAGTITELVKRLCPGGWIALDHYRRSLSRLRLAALVRLYYKRLPPEESMRKIERLVDRLLPLHRSFARSRVAHIALTRLSPVVDYYASLPGLTDEAQREWAFLDTYDSLTDVYKHLETERGLAKLLESAGAAEIEVWRGGNGVEARARKSPIRR